MGKPERKRQFGTPRLQRIDLLEVGCGGMDWIDLAQDTERGGHL